MALRLYHYQFKAMGCPCALHLYCDSPAQWQRLKTDLCQEVERLEQKYSRYRPDSFLSKVNRQAGSKSAIKVDAETAGLLNYAKQCYQQSEGLFDISAGILHQIWDFKAKQPQPPAPKILEKLLKLVGWDKIYWKAPYLRLPHGMYLDLGGIVKEYAVDSLAQRCHNQAIKAGLIDLGGDIRAIGAHPDGKPWLIGINHPRQAGDLLGEIALTTGALASSGDYERYFIYQGKRYSHLLNPKTGYPVTGLAAVSVAADLCIVAGSAATIAMLKGTAGQAWLDEQGFNYLCE